MSYYHPFIAFETCLRPTDLAGLTPQQMDGLWDYMEAKNG